MMFLKSQRMGGVCANACLWDVKEPEQMDIDAIDSLKNDEAT